MSASSSSSSAPARVGTARHPLAASLQRVRALTLAELRLLVRNRTAMFTALALPILTVLFLESVGVGEDSDVPAGALVTTSMIAFVLLFVVYYNLVTAYVARREELVLRRLRVGEATDAEILTGTALPSVAIAVAQVVLVTAGAALALDMGAPVNPVLVVVGLAAGVVLFVQLAGASTAFTRNVETAQVSTLPVMIVCMMFSGLLVPPEVLPDTAATAMRAVPLSPVVELARLGLTGRTVDGEIVDFSASFTEALVPTAVLVAWLVVGTWALRRRFRWEPRA